MKLKGLLIASVIILPLVISGFTKKEPVRFMKGNMHTHSHWSDGNTYPEKVAQWYRDHGYQFLAVTDHNLLQEGPKYKVIGKDSTLLRELANYRNEYEKTGEFLILSSEEISDSSEKKPVHLNGFNMPIVVKPTGGATVAECLAANVQAINKALQPVGFPEWVVVNHPNFGWGLTADDIAKCGTRFFEVYNGHPSVRNYGDKDHPGTETIWDEVNKWRIDHGEKLLYGTATDDTHQYEKYGVGNANPGRGWTQVKTNELTPAALYKAMCNGDFYASTGVELIDFQSDKKGISIKVKPEKGIKYTIEFIGWLAGKDKPEILKMVNGTKGSYRTTGKELFVRAIVISGKAKENPFAEGDKEMCWLQPVAVR
jgi:hypothetical protein